METVHSLEPLLDAKAAGRILGLNPRTVLRLARSGQLRGIRYPGCWRFRPSDIASWIKTKERLPARSEAA